MQIPEPKEGLQVASYRIDKHDNRCVTGAPLMANFVWVVGIPYREVGVNCASPSV